MEQFKRVFQSVHRNDYVCNIDYYKRNQFEFIIIYIIIVCTSYDENNKNDFHCYTIICIH